LPTIKTQTFWAKTPVFKYNAHQCIYAHAAQSLTQGQRRAAQAQMLPLSTIKNNNK